ncbi:MAG: putative ribonuclease [Bryobacterales bacterium]|nr:putative ribonuclease [Bryobacterales bacterium]
MDRFRQIRSLLSQTYSEWNAHDAPTYGAALSYYTMLSLAPLLVIAVAIGGLAFGKESAQRAILDQIGGLAGQPGAEVIKTMLANAQSPKAGLIASAIGFVVLLFGASGVFSALRKALNKIWDVQPKETSGWWAMVKDQLFSFTMVVGIGFLLLVSLVITAMLAGVGQFVSGLIPPALAELANNIVSIGVITVLFALIYRFVPEQTLPWRRLWPGSFATAILFTLGKYALGVYLGKAGVGSAYGAAGSLLVLFVWVYYSAQLFLFGAEFTRIFACQEAGVCPNLEHPASDLQHAPQPHAPR